MKIDFQKFKTGDILRILLCLAMIIMLLVNIPLFNTKGEGMVSFSQDNMSNALMEGNDFVAVFDTTYSGVCGVKVRFAKPVSGLEARKPLKFKIFNENDDLVLEKDISVEELSQAKYIIYDFDIGNLPQNSILSAKITSEETDENYAVRLPIGTRSRTDVSSWYCRNEVQTETPDITLTYSHFGKSFYAYLAMLVALTLLVGVMPVIYEKIPALVINIASAAFALGYIAPAVYFSERLNSSSILSKGPGSLRVMFLFYTGALLMLLGVTGKTGISSVIAGLLILIPSVVNYFVYLFRGTVFVPQDVFGAGTAAAVAYGYEFKLDVLLLLCIFITGGGLVLSHYFSIRTGKTLKARLITAFVFIPLGAFIVLQSITLPRKLGIEYNIFDQNASSHENGFMVNFLSNFETMGTKKPSGYSRSKLADEIREITVNFSRDNTVIQNGEITDKVKPNVIVVMDESFCDVSTLIDLEKYCPDNDIYSRLNELKAGNEGFVGQTAVSIWGGGTSGSEYEVLSGCSYRIDNTALAPYLKYYQTNTQSLASFFKQNGYDTLAMHQAKGSNWYRNRAYPNMGFDLIEFEPDCTDENTEMLRGYFSDMSCYDYVIDKVKSTDNPLFAFTVTIQNHGGYGDNEDLGPYRVNVKTDSENKASAQTYLGLMNASDKQLGAFIEKLRKLDEPVVLLFFGDHWSYFTDKIIADFGVQRQNMTEEELLRYYSTPYVMWSNCGYDFSTLPQRTSTPYLGALLCYQMGMELTPYQKLLIEAGKEYPVYSIYSVMDKNGSFVSAEDENLTRMTDILAKAQYNLLADTKNTVKELFTN